MRFTFSEESRFNRLNYEIPACAGIYATGYDCVVSRVDKEFVNIRDRDLSGFKNLKGLSAEFKQHFVNSVKLKNRIHIFWKREYV